MDVTVRLVQLAVVTCVFSLALPTLPVAVADSPEDPGAELDPDEIRFHVSLSADGSAEWRMEYALELEDEQARTAYEDIRSDIETNEDAYLAEFQDRINHFVTNAGAETGREMDARDFEIRTHETVSGDVGLIVYSFTWDGFASADGSTLLAGDSIDGLPLTDRMTLLVTWPTEYAPVAIEPEPTRELPSGVEWRGDGTIFSSGEPRVELEAPGNGPPILLLAAVMGGLAIAAGVFGWYLRRPRADEAGQDAMDERILTNEEQVLELLGDRGGRMRQQEIASTLEWTEAKTSYVISDLRDTGEVEVFRIGRENVVSLPGEGPDAGIRSQRD